MSTDLNMEYQEVKFGEIANHISKRVEPSETTLEIYVGLEHLDPDSLKITRHGVPSDVAGQKLLVKKGQIIFGKRRAYQRKVAVADWDCICSAHAMVLEAIPGKILPEFLPFFMQSNQFMERAVEISEGSLSPTIKWKVLENQKFSIPKIEIQEKILLILESIELNVLRNIEAIDSAKVVKNRFIDEVLDTQAKKTSLRDISIFLGRGISPKYSEEFTDHLIINQKCVRDGKILIDDIRYQKKGILVKDNAYLSDGDVCINSTGTGTLGRAGVWKRPNIEENIKFLIDSHVTRIQVDLSKYNPYLLVQILNSVIYQSKIYEECVTGSTNQIELNRSQFADLSIPLIELDKQNQFVKVLEKLDLSIEVSLNKILVLKELKNQILTF
ncbi:MAG: restriction endonuclease subunit S [Acinetobacter sp.]